MTIRGLRSGAANDPVCVSPVSIAPSPIVHFCDTLSLSPLLSPYCSLASSQPLWRGGSFESGSMDGNPGMLWSTTRMRSVSFHNSHQGHRAHPWPRPLLSPATGDGELRTMAPNLWAARKSGETCLHSQSCYDSSTKEKERNPVSSLHIFDVE